jgi:hypothetical protein
MAMAGKKLTALEMPEEEEPEVVAPAAPAPAPVAVQPSPPPVTPAQLDAAADYQSPTSIPLPPIPAAPVRRVMVQLSIKAPVDLVDRLEAMANATRAQKQAIIAAALNSYMRGHGY